MYVYTCVNSSDGQHVTSSLEVHATIYTSKYVYTCMYIYTCVVNRLDQEHVMSIYIGVIALENMLRGGHGQ